MNDSIHVAAVALLSEWRAQHEAARWRDALAAIAVTYDPECDSTTLNGPFPTPTEALAWAERHEADLNAGLAEGDLPWRVTVLPLEVAEPYPEPRGHDPEEAR